MKKGEQQTRSMRVIIAALNEEAGIGLTIAELSHYLNSPKIVVVDGKSVDRTVEVAKDLGAGVLTQANRGKGDALAKGFASLDSSVDYVVLTDADYTYPAEYIPEMIRILDEKRSVGMVCGNRFNATKTGVLGETCSMLGTGSLRLHTTFSMECNSRIH